LHVAGGAAINFSGTIARSVVLYLYTFMLARMLSPDELGEYFLVTIVINYLALIATLGLGIGVTRFVALYAGEGKNTEARNIMWVSMMIGVPTGLVFAVGLFFAAPYLNGILFHDSTTAVAGIRVFSVAIPMLVAAAISNAATQGMHRMKYQVYSRDLAEQLSKLGFSGAVLVMGTGLIGVIGANVGSVIVALSMAFVFALKVLPKEKGEVTRLTAPPKSIISYSLPLVFSGILVTLQTKVDTVLLGYFTTSANVGYYGVAISVSTFAKKINLAFLTVFSPIIADLWNRKKKGELSLLFKTVARWIFVLSLPVFILLAVLADPIMTLFGEAFVAGSGALVVITAGQFINSATGATGLMVLMSGRSKLELFNIALIFALDAAACLLLIPRFGIMGAAIANMLSIGIVNILRALEVWFLMRLHAYDRHYVNPAFAGISGGLMLFIASRYILGTVSTVWLVFLSTLFLAYYAIIIRAVGMSDQDRSVFVVIKSRLAGSS
jgi:O-antigen/teichoic acid export membrane protein